MVAATRLPDCLVFVATFEAIPPGVYPAYDGWMETKSSLQLVDTLRRVAPGTGLREGLDRILQARMGALLVIGDGPDVLSICSGGFLIDSEFSPQRLFELAKMDGAIILSGDRMRIARANVHLVPDSSISTSETGTRHRSAERVAKSVPVTVVAVSEELSVITVYRDNFKHQLKPTHTIFNRANQALATLERYKERLDGVLANLDNLEVAKSAKFKDVVTVLQRGELVRRISEEIAWYLLELGSDGRLLALQLDEVYLGFETNYLSVIQDFLEITTRDEAAELVSFLAEVPMAELLDLDRLAEGVKKHSCCPWVTQLDSPSYLEATMESRGTRQVNSTPQVPQYVKDALKETFGGLRPILEPPGDEPEESDPLDARWTRAVKDGIYRS